MRVLAVLAAILMGMTAATAQAVRAVAPAANGNAIADAVKALEKGGNTVLIVPQADVAAAAAAEAGPQAMTLSQKVASLRLAFEPVLANVPNIPAQLEAALYGAGGGSIGWLWPAALVTLASLAVGWAGLAIVARFLSHASALIGPAAVETRAGRIGRALAAIVRGWAGAAAFFGAGAVAALLMEPDISPPRVTALMTLGGIASYLTIRAVIHAVLAPGRPAERIVPLPGSLARPIAMQLLLTVLVTNVIAFVCFWFGYFPLEPLAHQFLLAVAPTFSAVAFIALAVLYRRPITLAILGAAPRPHGLRRIAAGLWLPLTVAYLLASGAATVILVGLEHRLVAGPVLAPTLALVIGLGVTGLLLIVHDRRLEPGFGNPRWSELCERIAIGVGTIVGFWSLALLWDLYGTGHGDIIDHALVFAVVLLVAWAAWRAVRIFVETRLAEEMADTRADGEGEGFGPRRLAPCDSAADLPQRDALPDRRHRPDDAAREPRGQHRAALRGRGRRPGLPSASARSR